jgi:hypothetical protein
MRRHLETSRYKIVVPIYFVRSDMTKNFIVAALLDHVDSDLGHKRKDNQVQWLVERHAHRVRTFALGRLLDFRFIRFLDWLFLVRLAEHPVQRVSRHPTPFRKVLLVQWLPEPVATGLVNIFSFVLLQLLHQVVVAFALLLELLDHAGRLV